MGLSSPARSTMPDLSGLYRKNILNLMLNAVFGGGGAKGIMPQTSMKNFVRLVDKALEDYEAARVSFQEYVSRQSNSVWSPLFRAIGHMENCLATVERAARYARRLTEDPEMSSHIPKLSVLTKQSQKRLSTIRNATEHMDDRVIKGKVSGDELCMLWLDESHLELERTQLEYEELATWLGELHALAMQLAVHRGG